ncbi:hypothetical protein MVEN_02117300 [Mycena venus]|uniref:Uncharacterized protein n=1 Tax=Mycena venus TaxID=2733690 RepID=A0A8H6XA71_9AGAR|nr:hypothetical protein MVEN_02117300 [Mycena venus]
MRNAQAIAAKEYASNSAQPPRLFFLAASALTYLSSVETPKVSSVGFVITEPHPSLPRLPLRRRWHPPEDIHVALSYNVSSFTTSNITYPTSLHTSIDPIANIDFDFDGLNMVYVTASSLARRLHSKTRVPWWTSFLQLLRAAFVVGGLAFRIGLGLDETKESLDEFIAVVNAILHPTMDRLCRVARYVLNLISAREVLFMITCLEFSPSTPLTFDDLIDLDKVVLTYVAIYSSASREDGPAMVDPGGNASRTAFILGEIAVRVGLGNGEELRAVIDLTRPRIVRFCRRHAFLCASALAPYRLIEAELNPDLLYIMTSLPLPFEVPLPRLFSALALNGTVVSVLACRFFSGPHLAPPSFSSSNPTGPT